MTEMVAAHLERVARELVQHLDDEQLVYWSMNEYGPSGIDGARNKAIEILAAALAACAREELQALLDKHETTMEDDFGGWEVVHAKYIRKRIEALERAAGEK